MDLYRPVTIGSLALPGNLFLAPVAGYTDRAFRSICGERGAALSFTELVSAESLIRNLPGERERGGGLVSRLLRRGEGEARYAVQLFGADPERVAEAAAMLACCPEALGGRLPEAIDINAGCPMPKVVKTGAGAALMKDPARLGRMVEALVRVSGERLGGIPVTIKMRSGWDSASINYIECALAAAEAGAAMVSLHGRTRAQVYSGRSDWACIGELASRLSIPVAGSGDLYTPFDAEQMLRETGCAAVMFARGAMGNPFIFSATAAFLQTGAWKEPENAVRIRAGLRQLELLAVDMGEKSACLEMRKQFCAYTKTLHGEDGEDGVGAGTGAGGAGGKKGFPGGAALRDALVHAQSIAAYRELFRAAGLI